MPTSVYGCKMWSLSEQQQSRVQPTQMNKLRRVEGVSRFDRIKYVDIREKLQQESILVIVKSRHEKWRIIIVGMRVETSTKRIVNTRWRGNTKGREKTRIEGD